MLQLKNACQKQKFRSIFFLLNENSFSFRLFNFSATIQVTTTAFILRADKWI